MEFTIRTYQDSDLDFIIESHKTMYAQEYGYNDVFFAYAKKTVTDFLAVTKWEREQIWIAEVLGKPVGCIALICPEPQNKWKSQLRWFLVLPEYRKYGIGAALMNNLLENAAAWDYKHIVFLTTSNLVNARAFYERYGFYETARVELPNWCDEVIYEVMMARDVYRPDICI